MTGLEVPHHDGSELYVSNDQPEIGETVTVLLRTPNGVLPDGVWARTVVDGEATLIEASVDRADETETWWRADIRIHNPMINYRFLIRRGQVVEWITQSGMQWWEPTDANDFRLSTYAAPPSWAHDSIFYQIFPDRFARSDAIQELPSWAIPAAWQDPLATKDAESVRQVYGGDLHGAADRLDHIASLGVDGIYLTPIFPATSSHRYDSLTFERVDPLLGGDEGLIRFTSEAHARGVRVLCDFVPNHCGNMHEWFLAAQADPGSPEATFFYFRRHPDDYVSWLDLRSLPKFDHRNEELRRRLYEGVDSIFGRWLRPPFDIDGWRVDVANMTGRYADVDLNRWVARAMRWTMLTAKPEAFLLAESFFDATPDLGGDGWHGVMNYAGFARPIWQWLASAETADQPWFPVLAPASAVISYFTMRDFMAAVSWRTATHNFNLLDSHDTARFRSITGDRARTKVGVGVQFTFVGIPMFFAGDEFGLEGYDANDTRKTMPWDDPARRDEEMLAWYRQMSALRRSSPALRHGGLRWVSVTDEAMVYLRESRDERLLIHASRRPHEPVILDAAQLAASTLEPLVGEDARVSGGKITLPADGPAFNVWRLSR